MRFQLRSIVLWPRNEAFQPRLLRFESGRLNVITGASQTGKSAIIPIIDYCLGADKCSIPVETIRNHCSWFGVVVETTEGRQKLFARRGPGDRRSTGDMFIREGPEVDIPGTLPSHNTNLAAVKRSLDEMAGLTNLDFDADATGSGFRGRPSFRDMAAFLFQPQNVVANPDVFFFRADTYEHQEKLRTVFPYVLGVLTPQLLAAQHELGQLRRELRRKQSERANIEQVSQRWMAEIQARVDEARELGLVAKEVPTSADREQLVEILTQAISVPVGQTQITEQALSDSIQELQQLRQEEAKVSQELAKLRHRLSQMDELQRSSARYREALEVQRDRLGISEWLTSIGGKEHHCPICGSHMDANSKSLEEMVHALRELEESAGVMGQIPAAFDREHQRVGQELRIATERLNGVRTRIRGLERRSAEVREKQYQLMSTARFVGNVENALAVYRSLGVDSSLSEEIAHMEARIAQLGALISESQVRAREQRALKMVEMNAARILPSLDVERPNTPISLSVKDLSIKVMGQEREDYLWEIGSGSNWLSYHVAVTLALQQFFLALPRSPVPSFLVYDQPSQVYFPRKLADPSRQDDDPRLSDEDLLATRKVYAAIDEVVGSSSGALQVIVLDHADSAVWGDLPNVKVVEEWRGGRKLVPVEWLQ